MNLKLFIERPLLSMVINIIIVTLGLMALSRLPIEKFPDIAPPTVYVWAGYSGADAETIQKTVIAPLEQAINGVDKMIYMKSTAEQGAAMISVYFEQGTNTDMAAVNVQNRVVQAQGMLPAEVTKNGVTVEKQQPGQLRILALESPNGTYDEAFLTNYFYHFLRPALLRIQGVAKVDIWGGQYALRIWLKPEQMARYGIVPSDITAALEQQNIEAGIGTIGSESDQTYQYNIRYTGRKQTVEDFEHIILRSNANGEILFLKDVAEIELGQSDGSYVNTINKHPGVMGSISQMAGSNATQINLDIDAQLDELKTRMPKDIEILTFENTNDFLFASIHEVIETLVIAIILVLLIVLVFVRSLRATLVPALSIGVSIIGTFAFMMAAGFSINMLTLFALVLVIGTVVDDSIIVVEAVQARFEAGTTHPKTATLEAMHGLTAALMTTTIVFMVIFVPVSMMNGTTGIFYRQFGLTMAVAVGISLLTALTLSPALSALMLKAPKDTLKRTFTQCYRVAFQAVVDKYAQCTHAFVRHKWLAFVFVATAALGATHLMSGLPKGFIPDEDMGTVMIDVSTPSGYTLPKTQEVLDRLTTHLEALPDIEAVGAVAGMGGANRGMIYIQLTPWQQRTTPEQSANAVVEQINEILSAEIEAQSFAMAPGMIDGFGNGGFELSILNLNEADIHTFNDVTQKFIETLRTRPEIMDVQSSFDANLPQYRLDIDAVRCQNFGVSPGDLLGELSAFLGSAYISDFNQFHQTYQVSMQLRASDREQIQALDRLHIRSSSGDMLPISQFVILTKELAPQMLTNFNMIGSIELFGSIADGFSSGDAIQAARDAASSLPDGYALEFDGLTREEIKVGSSATTTFAICIFFVYLVLAALYESLFIPLAVLLSVPFGLCGAFLFARHFGTQNDIYFQIGLIMLIGLMAKTSILLTEYAVQSRRDGMSIPEAALAAAKSRFRPILMTALTMIFGMLPLLFASGVGANGRRTIGACIVGGMLFGTLGLLLIVPALFVTFQNIHERLRIK